MAIVGCAVATGVGAVRNTAAVPPDATVGVIGCGGVGLSVIQGARLAQALADRRLRPQPRPSSRWRSGSARPRPSRTPPSSSDLDYVFDAIGQIETTEAAIGALALGGAAVIVGLPPTGQTARFDPLALAEANQRILGSNYGSIDPQHDIPWIVDLYKDGDARPRLADLRAAAARARRPRRSTTSRRAARCARC